MASLSIREVLWTESAREKAGARGIVEDDVEDAIRRQPLVREQKSRLVQSNEGVWRVRPTRVLAIGRTSQGEVLTMVFELPDEQGRAVAVTAWHSGENDIARYAQYIGAR